MEKQTANKKQTKGNEACQSKSKKRKITKMNSYSKLGATSANGARSNGQVHIDTGLDDLAMLNMMMDTLQRLNSTSREKANKVQITQKNATKNKPQKQKKPTSGSSVVKQTGPMKPSTYPITDVTAMSMVSTSKNAKIEEMPIQLDTVNTAVTTQKQQNEHRPCTSVAAKPKAPSKSAAYPKRDVIIPSRVYKNKNKNGHRKTPTNNGYQSKIPNETKNCYPSVNSIKAKPKKQNEPDPGKNVAKTIGPMELPKDDISIPNKMSTNKYENNHRTTPANPIPSTSHLESIKHNKCKSKQKVPHPKLTSVSAYKQKQNRFRGLKKTKERKETVAHPKHDVMKPSKSLMLEECSPIYSKAIEPIPDKQENTPIVNGFEQQVTYLLNTGKRPTRYLKKKIQFIPELTLTGIRDERQAIMQDRLESFVDQLVGRNVGFLAEGRLIINAHHNMLSFVYFVRSKKRVCFCNITLRQCALHGDLVKVFVMNKPEVSPADTNAVENYLGFVVAIIEKRHDRTCIGPLLPQENQSYYTLVPQDLTIPSVRIYKPLLTKQLIDNAMSEENGNGAHSKEIHSTETTVLYQTKIIEWDGEIPIGSNLDLVDNTINQRKYINDNKIATFEQQVNYLLNTGKRPGKNVARKSTKKYNPELTLPCIRDESQNIVQAKLESFVDQMVEKKVGYLVERSLRVNVYNNKESFVDGSGRKKEGVCIGSIPLRQYAFHGDLVKVFVMNTPKLDDPKDSVRRKTRTERRERREPPKGFVVAILEKRHKRQCVGMLLPQQDSKYRILDPLDAKIPRVRIYKQNLPTDLNKMRTTGVATKFCLAEIIEWQGDIPIGANLKFLDQTSLLKNQNEYILIEHHLEASPYADHILAQLPSVLYSIPQEEIDLREDLRRECTFTIDSASARHLDDALSCKMLENGNWEIGVHISDVTYFLREQSELDEVAKLRATSIYMVDNVYRMLPEQLCDVCSLLPGQEKLTFSVFFEILRDGTVVNTRFARSVINSCAKLSYENAQKMINSAKGEGSSEEVVQQIFHGYTVQSLSLILCQLHSIAVKLRQRRIEQGFLELDQSRLTFWFDTATGCPIEYDQHKDTTFDVLMVQANTSAAQAIEGALSSSALIRCPQPPSEKKIEEFVKTMAGHGYTISFASSRTVRESMASIIAAAEHPDVAKIVLNKLLGRFKNHQAPTLVYTNFTSPIRRYTDCMVHRVLAAKLGFGEKSKRTLEELEELAKTCNMKRNKAKVAGDASLMLCYRQWLKTVQKHETIAGVFGYDAEHIELILLGTGITLNIVTKKISSIAKVVFNSSKPIDGIQWIPADSSMPAVTLKIFSKVRVTITSVGDNIGVCSILPVASENTSTRESYKDFHKHKKTNFINHRILLSIVAAITVISSLAIVKKLCKFK